MSESGIPKRRLLAISDEAGLSDLLARLDGLVDAHVVRDSDGAAAALRTDHFDYLLSSAAELLPLAQVVGPHRVDTVLENIGHGVCIVDREGTLLWANSRLLSYPPAVTEAVRPACAELLNALDAAGQSAGRREIAVEGLYFELSVARLPSGAAPADYAVGLIWDTTSAHRLQHKIDAIEAAGRELVRLEADAYARMDMGERLRFLEENIIRYSRELLNFKSFVVRVLDPKTNRLECVLAAGFSEEARALPMLALPEGNGISGYVAATGQSYLCPDVSRDPRYLHGIEHASSSLTVPLRVHDRVVGILNVESDQPNAFSEQDRQFAEIFAHYVSTALNVLKLLAVERHATAGQITSDVLTELSRPLNDIVMAATNLIEENLGNEALRRGLHAMIETVDRTKKRLRALAETPVIAGLVRESSETDPVVLGKRILVADDEEIIRDTMNDVLNRAGAVIVTAADGDEAVRLARSQHFDLVISDIKMPNKNGYEVFAAVRQALPGCPVILVTGFGYDPEHTIVRANREGLAGVLFKPFKVDVLMDTIRKSLDPAAANTARS